MNEEIRIIKGSSVLKNQAQQKREEAAYLRGLAARLSANAEEIEARALHLEGSADRMDRLATVKSQVEVHG